MSEFLNRLGHDNFVWWLGVVEDRIDPLNLSRCRVRIFGSHNENKVEIPTDSLPWAQVVLPVNNTSTRTPMEGDYVFGFFLDGLSSQAPCILGIFPGIPQEFTNTTKGFSDPRTSEQIQSAPRKTVFSSGGVTEGTPSNYPSIVGEPTTSRLARAESLDKTIVEYKKNNLDQDVPTATGGSWSEPATDYAAKYPYNQVMETESGHIMEFDDTPSAERIHIAHRMGTFEEIGVDGSKVTKVVGDTYQILLKDNNVHIKGVYNLTVDGAATILVNGDVNIKTPQAATIDCNSATINASDTTINSPTTVNGDLNVSGQVTASGDVVGSGVSLSSHIHGGVQNGGGKTSPPV
jgi:phage baseplate assembly protein gpV